MSEVTPITRQGGHIPALDGLRGVAILAVFCLHYGGGGIYSSSAAVRWVGTVCRFGWTGVDLFFVLSGFLITGILYDTQRDSRYYRKFYARRALRIFPIYYLFIALAVLIVPFASLTARHLLFLVYLGYPAALIWPALVSLPILITHLWSLQVEEQFYMLWPWLIRRLKTTRSILMLCAAVGVAAPILRLAFPSWSYASLPCRADDLVFGAALAILFRSQHWRSCQRCAYPVLFASIMGIILLCDLRHTTEHTDPVIFTVGFTVIAIACGALLVLSLGPLSKVFSSPVLRIFGKYSYGMYLYHLPLMVFFERGKPLFIRYHFGILGYVFACLVANLAIAAFSFHLFEQPILKLKKRFDYTTTISVVTAPVQEPLTIAFDPEPNTSKALAEGT